jgi:hypothetical protein
MDTGVLEASQQVSDACGEDRLDNVVGRNGGMDTGDKGRNRGEERHGTLGCREEYNDTDCTQNVAETSERAAAPIGGRHPRKLLRPALKRAMKLR